jgi:predicted transcriptional regulator of viral defense system
VAAQGGNFLLRHVAPTRLFGLETLWRGRTKVTISDAARTLIDLIAMPETGGGMDHVAECLATYLHGQNPDFELLIRYANQYGKVRSSNVWDFWRRRGFIIRPSPMLADSIGP